MEIEKYTAVTDKITEWLDGLKDDSMAITLLREQIIIKPEDTDKARKKHIDGLKILLNMSGRTDLPNVTRNRGPHREAVYARNTDIQTAANALFEVVGEFMHKHDSGAEYGEWLVKNLAEGNHRHHTKGDNPKNTSKGA